MKPSHVWERATQLRAEKEKLYGTEAWRGLGIDGCLEAGARKATYLKAQRSNGLTDTEKFREDLLDMINWAAFTYCLVEESSHESDND